MVISTGEVVVAKTPPNEDKIEIAVNTNDFINNLVDK